MREKKININDISGLALEEVDYGISFGYEADIKHICSTFSQGNLFKIMTCNHGSEEITALKK